MHPSSQTQSSSRRTTERTGLLCQVKYCNNLPNIPFEPKSLAYKLDPRRFVRYKPTSLEKRQKHALWTERDLGVPIDLINPSAYKVDPAVVLGPVDRSLLEEDKDVQEAPASSGLGLEQRSSLHAKVVPWMRKPEYISTEVNRYGVSNAKPKGNDGESEKQCFVTKEIYKDRDSQIAAVEKTFEDAKKPIARHHSRAGGVTPVEVLPVFPDFKMWGDQCAQVVFDSDPAPRKVSAPAVAVEMVSQALIKAIGDKAVGSECVGYFLPSEETLRKRKRDADKESDQRTPTDELYDYHLAQEYNWEVKNKASKDYEDTYFFVFRDGDGVYFNKLDTRLLLGKRRRPSEAGGGGAQQSAAAKAATIVCKIRDMNEKELRAQEARRAGLENHEAGGDKDDDDVGKDLKESASDKSSGGAGSDAKKNSDQAELGGQEQEQSWREEEDDGEGEKQQGPVTSGNESGEDRRATQRDEEEIFGNDDEEDNDDNTPNNSAGCSEEEEEEEEEKLGNVTSGNERGEDRIVRDEEEIFGRDGEEDNDDMPTNSARCSEEEEEEEEEEEQQEQCVKGKKAQRR